MDGYSNLKGKYVKHPYNKMVIAATLGLNRRVIILHFWMMTMSICKIRCSLIV